MRNSDKSVKDLGARRHFTFEGDTGYYSHENSGSNHSQHHNNNLTYSNNNVIKVQSPQSESLYDSAKINMNKKDASVVPPPFGGLGGPPVPIKPNISVHVEPQLPMGKSYWTVNFSIVFLPFILIGVPIHALLMDFTHPPPNYDHEKEQKQKYPYSKSINIPGQLTEGTRERGRERSSAALLDKLGVDRDGRWRGGRFIEGQGENLWLSSLFSGCLSGCLTLILVPIALSSNFPAGFYFYNLFYNLAVLGKIPEEIVQYTINFVQSLPFLILVDYVWIFGYQIRNRLTYFKNSPMQAQISRSIRRGQLGKNNNDTEYHGRDNFYKYCDEKTWNSILAKTSGCRFKMILMYLIIIGIHVIHGFIIEYQRKKEEWTTEKVIETWQNYVPTIMLTLMLPAYSCFCWAILFQLQILSGFIDALIIQRKLKRSKADNIGSEAMLRRGEDPLLKREFLSLFKSSYRQIADSILQINRHFSLYMSFVFICLGISIFLEVQEIITFFIGMFFKNSSKPGEEAAEVLTPGLVRTFVGMAFNLLLYVLLVIITLWQAVGVNDEAREFHVALNDLASESGIQKRDEDQIFGQVYNQDFQLVQAFRLLKFYVHSRMEQEKPALLNITLLSFVPGLKARLTNYRVLH